MSRVFVVQMPSGHSDLGRTQNSVSVDLELECKGLRLICDLRDIDSVGPMVGVRVTHSASTQAALCYCSSNAVLFPSQIVLMSPFKMKLNTVLYLQSDFWGTTARIRTYSPPGCWSCWSVPTAQRVLCPELAESSHLEKWERQIVCQAAHKKTDSGSYSPLYNVMFYNPLCLFTLWVAGEWWDAHRPFHWLTLSCSLSLSCQRRRRRRRPRVEVSITLRFCLRDTFTLRLLSRSHSFSLDVTRNLI